MIRKALTYLPSAASCAAVAMRSALALAVGFTSVTLC